MGLPGLRFSHKCKAGRSRDTINELCALGKTPLCPWDLGGYGGERFYLFWVNLHPGNPTRLYTGLLQANVSPLDRQQRSLAAQLRGNADRQCKGATLHAPSRNRELWGSPICLAHLFCKEGAWTAAP